MNYLDKIKSIRLIDYAEALGFQVKKIGKYYTLKEHDSVRIDDRLNCFWRNSKFQMGQKGGAGSILDFAMEFANCDTIREAIQDIKERLQIHDKEIYKQSYITKVAPVQQKEEEPKEFTLPDFKPIQENAIRYLKNERKIAPEIINYFIQNHMLYEDYRNNCVFVKDQFACLRGTKGRFVGDVPGCDYSKGFFFGNTNQNLIITESVIDIMSVMSYLKLKNIDYNQFSYLALSGTNKTEAIFNQLDEHKFKNIYLSLDNDEAGEEASKSVMERLQNDYPEVNGKLVLPPQGKDWNEYIQQRCPSVLDYIKKKGTQEIPGNNKKKHDLYL